jgi:hypothetical protein
MSLPTELDKTTITKLILARGTLQRTGGQEADVTANEIEVPGGFPNCTLANMDAYTELAIEIPLSVIASSNTIDFKITVKGSEMVGHNYKLMYETAQGLFAADHLIFHSSVSETAHNYSHTAIGWNNSQYIFCNINQLLTNTPTVYCGTQPSAKVLKMGNYDSFTGSALSYNFTANVKHSINFLNLIDMHDQDAWHYRNELWLDLGAGSAYCGTGVYEFNPDAYSGTYWLDFFLDGMDASMGGERKFTLTNSINITIDNLGIVEDFAQRFLAATLSFADKTQEQKVEIWGGFADEYSVFNGDQKELFKTNTESTVINEARLRYECIASRSYTGLYDFVFNTAPQPTTSLMPIQQTSLIIILVCMATLAGAAFITLTILKKKKTI